MILSSSACKMRESDTEAVWSNDCLSVFACFQPLIRVARMSSYFQELVIPAISGNICNAYARRATCEPAHSKLLSLETLPGSLITMIRWDEEEVRGLRILLCRLARGKRLGFVFCKALQGLHHTRCPLQVSMNMARRSHHAQASWKHTRPVFATLPSFFGNRPLSCDQPPACQVQSGVVHKNLGTQLLTLLDHPGRTDTFLHHDSLISTATSALAC